MDLSLLKYPRKSHRKKINLPEESIDLAELMGIEFGDGGINNPWQLIITLNALSDLEYSTYITQLAKKLFDIEVKIRKRPPRNTLVLACSSTSLVDFLVSKGAVRGNKLLQNIDIPKWILGNKEFEKYFVRGLVDTDGCLYIHKHMIKGNLYKNIGFCFSSGSKQLIFSVAKIMRKFGIEPHITGGDSQIYLYSQKAVLDYLNVFGSSNPRITKKYLEWRGARVAE